MPGCAVHLLLATRALERWRGGQGVPPFPISDAGCAGAFHAGCLGPDIGYYPGCDPMLAHLAHYLSAVDLVRALVRRAPDDRSRAFAWGWATHVLADVWIHPLVNRGVGRLHGRGGPEGLTYAEDPVLHIRVELGLDAYYAGTGEWPMRIRPTFPLEPGGVDFVAEAYDETYRIRLDRRRLRASFRTASLLLPGMLAYERWLAPAMRRDAGGRGPLPPSGAALAMLGAASWLLPNGSAVRGLLRPCPPPAKLIDEVESVMAQFAARFHLHSERGLVDLPPLNLDTGMEEGDDPEYPLSLSALRSLERLRGRIPSS